MARNELVAGKDGRLRAEPTGEAEDLDAGLVSGRSATAASRCLASPSMTARDDPNEGAVCSTLADGAPLLRRVRRRLDQARALAA